MLNVVSIVIGVVAMLFAMFFALPLLGGLNWLVLPFALLGASVGQLSGRKSGRNLNLIVFVLAAIRLSLGGGIL